MATFFDTSTEEKAKLMQAFDKASNEYKMRVVARLEQAEKDMPSIAEWITGYKEKISNDVLPSAINDSEDVLNEQGKRFKQAFYRLGRIAMKVNLESVEETDPKYQDMQNDLQGIYESTTGKKKFDAIEDKLNNKLYAFIGK